MHFIDFLIRMLHSFGWILKNIYLFAVEYVIPALSYIVPILVTLISQLISLAIRIFFLYISPCVVHVVVGITYIFTHTLRGLNKIATKVIESNINLEYVYGIIFGSLMITIFYYRLTGRVWHFMKECGQILTLHVRFIMNISRMLVICMKYVHGKVTCRKNNKPMVKEAREKDVEKKYTDEMCRSTQKSLKNIQNHVRKRYAVKAINPYD